MQDAAGTPASPHFGPLQSLGFLTANCWAAASEFLTHGSGVERGPNLHVSHECPGDAHALGPGTTF